jgi:putative ABC transport system permease protein
MGEAVLGSEVRLRMGEEFFAAHGRAGDKHAPGEEDEDEDEHRHDNGAFVVVGRMPATGSPFDRAILVPIESVWAIHGQPVGHSGSHSRLGPPYDGEVPGVPAVVVRPKQVADAYQLRSEYRHNGALALFPAEVLTSIYQSLGDVRDLLVAASAANNLLLLASILMLATILVGLRRRRYAVLRALGATRTFVALTIWGGLVSLLAIGASLGLLLGFGAARLLSTWMQMRSGLALAPALGDGEILFSLGIFSVGALLMGAVSTVMALKGDVAKQLRF